MDATQLSLELQLRSLAVASSATLPQSKADQSEEASVALLLQQALPLVANAAGLREKVALQMAAAGGYGLQHALSDLMRPGTCDKLREQACALLLCLIAVSPALAHRLQASPVISDLHECLQHYANSSSTIMQWAGQAIAQLQTAQARAPLSVCPQCDWAGGWDASLQKAARPKSASHHRSTTVLRTAERQAAQCPLITSSSSASVGETAHKRTITGSPYAAELLIEERRKAVLEVERRKRAAEKEQRAAAAAASEAAQAAYVVQLNEVSETRSADGVVQHAVAVLPKCAVRKRRPQSAQAQRQQQQQQQQQQQHSKSSKLYESAVSLFRPVLEGRRCGRQGYTAVTHGDVHGLSYTDRLKVMISNVQEVMQQDAEADGLCTLSKTDAVEQCVQQHIAVDAAVCNQIEDSVQEHMERSQQLVDSHNTAVMDIDSSNEQAEAASSDHSAAQQTDNALLPHAAVDAVTVPDVEEQAVALTECASPQSDTDAHSAASELTAVGANALDSMSDSSSSCCSDNTGGRGSAAACNSSGFLVDDAPVQLSQCTEEYAHAVPTAVASSGTAAIAAEVLSGSVRRRSSDCTSLLVPIPESRRNSLDKGSSSCCSEASTKSSCSRSSGATNMSSLTDTNANSTAAPTG
jgi:hypothetical protein